MSKNDKFIEENRIKQIEFLLRGIKKEDYHSVLMMIERILNGCCSCEHCRSNKECKYAFDMYNMDGDCLMTK